MAHKIHRSGSAKSQGGLFASLLDRARIQWLMGDWLALAAHDVSAFEGNPERATIALLCASGHALQGNADAAKHYFALARKWGVDRTLAINTLLGGTHYSLGRAAYLAGRSGMTLLQLQKAATLGFAGAAAGRHAPLAAAQIIQALGFESSGTLSARLPLYAVKHAQDVAEEAAWKASPTYALDATAADYLAAHNIREIASHINVDAPPRNESLAVAARTLQRITGAASTPALDITQLDFNRRQFLFTNIHGDYIPSLIKTHASFYESAFLKALGCLHSSEGLVIDVGANIGNHAMYFAGVLGAEVIAIEPEPHNYFCLSLNALLNTKCSQIHCWNIACGKKEDRTTLEMQIDYNFGSWSAAHKATPNSTSGSFGNCVEVPVSTLDSVVNNNSLVSILKIDVEGMEMDVLEGANRLISRHLPVIAVECFTYSVFTTISAFLRRYGYFPVQALNATPTFIFVSDQTPHHWRRLKTLLQSSAVTTACKSRHFAS
jgi:FkbM family methyltransferase